MFRVGGSLGPVRIAAGVTEVEFAKLIGWLLALSVVVAIVMNLWVLGCILVVIGCLALLTGRLVEASVAIVVGVSLWVWVGPAVHDYFKYGVEVPEVDEKYGADAEAAKRDLRGLGFQEVREERDDFGLTECTVVGTSPDAGEHADIREPITVVVAC